MDAEKRAFISLNNAGVSLLQRRCFEQGHKTLCDAVHLLNKMHVVDSQIDLSSFCYKAALREADQRLSQPQVDASDLQDLKVLSDFPTKDMTNPSIATCCLLRMEAHQVEEEVLNPPLEVDMQAAIVHLLRTFSLSTVTRVRTHKMKSLHSTGHCHG